MKKSPGKSDKKKRDGGAAKKPGTLRSTADQKIADPTSASPRPPAARSTALSSSAVPTLQEKVLQEQQSGEPGTSISTEAKKAETHSPADQARRPKRRTAAARPSGKAFKVPSILLEGDLPPAPAASGPGLRYALAPQPVGRPKMAEIGELPEAYGTGRIFLAARDPHWLYASWDFTREQQNELNARSRDGHLVLRIFAEGEGKTSVPEVHVHPESRNWFVNVPRAETRYSAEIGFYERSGAWHSVSVSQSTFAPPEAPSEDLTADFATIPPQVTFQQVLETVEQFVTRTEGQPLLETVAEAQKQEQRAAERSSARPESKEQIDSTRAVPRSESRRGLGSSPRRSAIPVRIEPGRPWRHEQRAALKRLILIDERRRVFLGSIEITELVRRRLEEEELSSIALQEAAGVPVPLPGEAGGVPGPGISSPLGGERPRARSRKFWFKVNAELVVYGATEPDAKVTVAERPIPLRPDGTFSFRFSLPDGQYQLPAIAISGDGEEARAARLEFTRSTEYQGEVEAHPQDAALRPPRAENIQ
jgi:uncharacterized protein